MPTTRVSVNRQSSGQRGPQFIGMLAALSAALFLAGVLWAGRIHTPDMVVAEQRLYVLNDQLNALLALHPPTQTEMYRVAGADLATLSADQGTLYTLATTTLAAYAALDGAPRWQQSVRPVYPTAAPTSALLAHPAGEHIYTLESYAGSQALIERAAATGAPTGYIFDLAAWPLIAGLFLSPDGSRLYVHTPSQVVLLDLATKLVLSSTQPHLSVDNIAWMLLDSAGREVTLGIQAANEFMFVRLNALALDQTSLLDATPLRLDLPPDTQIAGSLARSADGRWLAVPLISAAGVEYFLVFNNQQPALSRLIELQAALVDLAFAPTDDYVYALEQAAETQQVRVYAADGQLLERWPIASGATQLLFGSWEPQPQFLPTALPRPQTLPTVEPLPTFEFEPHYAVPQPLPTPFMLPPAYNDSLTITTELQAAAPVAWLKLPRLNGFDVLEVRSDGTETVLAHQVQQALSLPNAPPALLGHTDSGSRLVDPLTTTYTVPARLLERCVMNAARTVLACVTAEHRLQLVQLATATVHSEQLQWKYHGGVPFALSDQFGVLGYSLHEGRRIVWRIDPRSFEVDVLLSLDEADRFVYNEAHARLFFSAGTELGSYELHTGAFEVFARSEAPWTGRWSVAADGKRLAYAHLSTAAGLYDMVIYDLQQHSYTTVKRQQAYIRSSLDWSSDSEAVLFRTHEPADAPQRERLWVVRLHDHPVFDTVISYALPGNVIDIGAATSELIIALVYENATARVLLLQPFGLSGISLRTPLGQERPTLLYVPCRPTQPAVCDN